MDGVTGLDGDSLATFELIRLTIKKIQYCIYQKTNGKCIDSNQVTLLHGIRFKVRPPNIPILLKIRGPRQLALKILRKKKGFEAVNDICHIIGEWYNIVLECYNDGLAEDRKFDSFINSTGQLHKLHRSLRLLQIAPDQPEDFGDHLKNA
uniref:Uncharacterized protein n=1 Tax=Rhizophagus irregularis (strain DAOM 181602 / DAOM 197198 / MUCL 43194) TaxID=747089 RepID=U9TA43_RHIID